MEEITENVQIGSLLSLKNDFYADDMELLVKTGQIALVLDVKRNYDYYSTIALTLLIFPGLKTTTKFFLV